MKVMRVILKNLWNLDLAYRVKFKNKFEKFTTIKTIIHDPKSIVPRVVYNKADGNTRYEFRMIWMCYDIFRYNNEEVYVRKFNRKDWM